KIKYDKPKEAFIYQATHNKTLNDRIIALDKIKSELTPEVDAIILGFLSDKSPVMRSKALSQVDLSAYPAFKSKVIELASSDKDPGVRANALELLTENPQPEYEAVFIKNINDEVSYSVLASALTGLNRMNKEKAGPLVAKYEKEESSVMTNAISAIYMANGDPKALTLIEGKLDDVEDSKHLVYLEHIQNCY
ncbi:MAG: HEAT repeat domain-containing protein, partial [Saprospiraceae bacterium]|nr:HEAT repeat domain-containing protein [Candidatus Brachybacter algidus]